jgi:hypothetical protein
MFSLAAAELPVYEVRRTPVPIVVDGKIDEAAWKSAPAIPFVFPWDSQTGAKQNTTARLLWDDQFLYVAYECEDTEITAHYQNRDDPTYRDDAVEIFINPAPDHANYYGIEMNVLAVVYDYLMIPNVAHITRVNFEGIHIATAMKGTLNVSGDKDQGWSLEVAFPWRNFELAKSTPPAPGTEWRANLNRWDGTEPNRRLSQWSNSGMPTPNPHNPARFGRIIFVK